MDDGSPDCRVSGDGDNDYTTTTPEFSDPAMSADVPRSGGDDDQEENEEEEELNADAHSDQLETGNPDDDISPTSDENEHEAVVGYCLVGEVEERPGDEGNSRRQIIHLTVSPIRSNELCEERRNQSRRTDFGLCPDCLNSSLEQQYPFMCARCDMRFASHLGLTRHLLMYHPDERS